MEILTVALRSWDRFERSDRPCRCPHPPRESVLAVMVMVTVTVMVTVMVTVRVSVAVTVIILVMVTFMVTVIAEGTKQGNDGKMGAGDKRGG